MNGTKLKKLRELRNFTQEHMAKELGVTQQNYSKMEKTQNDFPTEKVEKLAKILNIDADKLNNFDEKIIFNQDGFSFSDSVNINFGESIAHLQKAHQAHVEDLRNQITHLKKENVKLHSLLEKTLTK